MNYYHLKNIKNLKKEKKYENNEQKKYENNESNEWLKHNDYLKFYQINIEKSLINN